MGFRIVDSATNFLGVFEMYILFLELMICFLSGVLFLQFLDIAFSIKLDETMF